MISFSLRAIYTRNTIDLNYNLVFNYICRMGTIELRSDTFTKPSNGMMDAMMHARVGDDVFGEDESVNALESFAAKIFGMEAAIFCPSGTMTNQIAIKSHTQPGDEVICDVNSHVYIYEGGGIAFNSGCQVKPIIGDRGRITGDAVKQCVNPDDVHKAHTKLVVLENTCNRGGGSCYEIADIEDIKAICDSNDLALHLDGARLFNALVAKGQKASQYANSFDSISICLSKGLGAPVGSLLLGSHTLINNSRRIRKVLGGGMRQAGFIAAAGMFALENNIERLSQDHEHAAATAAALVKKDFVGKMLPVETNIIIFEVFRQFTPQGFCDYLRQHAIYCLPISSSQVRMVFHLDVTSSMVDKLISIVNAIV